MHQKIDFTRWTESGFRVFPVNGKHPHWASLPLIDNKRSWAPFTTRCPSSEELDKWDSSDEHTGVAVLTGEVSGIIALDWDCFNDYPDIVKYIPESPVIRVGKSPKWMRLYKYNPELPSTKIKLRVVNNIQDGIEVLTNGRYFVADGIHPETHKPYFYVSEHLLSVDKNKLPEFPLQNWLQIERLSRQYREGVSSVSSANGGRHDELLTYTGKLISAGVSKREAVKLIHQMDSTFNESYFSTHKNTAPDKMYDSVSKTHKKNLKAKLLKAIPTEVVTESKEHSVTVHVDDGSEPAPSSAAVAKFLSLGMDVSAQGKPIKNEANALKLVRNWTQVLHPDFIWYDEFHKTFFTKGLNNSGPLELWDNKKHLIELLIIIQEELKFHGLTKNVLEDAVFSYGRKRARNEVSDYITALQWDGVPRINTFLHTCFGADDTQYTRYASKNLLIGLLARAMNPGCKLDTMVVLEGKQGKMKSTGLKALAGDAWFTESFQDPTNKDFYVGLQGKLLVEISELESFNKADTTTIKRMLSCSTDRFRAPYGEIAMDWPRHNIFVGTTNDSGYLKDSTGNRRFWPVLTSKVDVDEIAFFRDMYFAEAYSRFKAGESWWQMPEIETLEIQESRMQEDSWQSTIEDYLSRNTHTTVKDVAVSSQLSFKLQDVNKAVENRIAACLRKAGWVPAKPYVNGKQIRAWIKNKDNQDIPTNLDVLKKPQ